MRVIAGTARGTRLATAKDERIRPTLDRVREALFNILAPRIENARFLDLFAGTGANGIEALSRGAAAATFVDNDGRSLAIVRRNLAAARVAARARLHRFSLHRDLAALAEGREQFDVIFADPPYGFGEYEALLAGVCQHSLLAPGGVMVVEHARRATIASGTTGLECTRQAEYGDTSLSFYAE